MSTARCALQDGEWHAHRRTQNVIGFTVVVCVIGRKLLGGPLLAALVDMKFPL